MANYETANSALDTLGHLRNHDSQALQALKIKLDPNSIKLRRAIIAREHAINQHPQRRTLTRNPTVRRRLVFGGLETAPSSPESSDDDSSNSSGFESLLDMRLRSTLARIELEMAQEPEL